jgi:hypothetical protein
MHTGCREPCCRPQGVLVAVVHLNVLVTQSIIVCSCVVGCTHAICYAFLTHGCQLVQQLHAAFSLYILLLPFPMFCYSTYICSPCHDCTTAAVAVAQLPGGADLAAPSWCSRPCHRRRLAGLQCPACLNLDPAFFQQLLCIPLW